MLLSLDRRMCGTDVLFVSEHSIDTYVVTAFELSAFLGELATFCTLMGASVFNTGSEIYNIRGSLVFSYPGQWGPPQ